MQSEGAEFRRQLTEVVTELTRRMKVVEERVKHGAPSLPSQHGQSRCSRCDSDSHVHNGSLLVIWMSMRA